MASRRRRFVRESAIGFRGGAGGQRNGAGGDGMIRAVKTHALLVLLLLGVASCGVLDPRLPAVPAPPSQKPGQVILQVPAGVIDDLAQDSVRQRREEGLAFLDQTRPERVRRILAGQITIGMSEQEVVWAFLSHPTRVRDMGPPGGHTMLWEPERYFVRFDAAGQAVQAGRY